MPSFSRSDLYTEVSNMVTGSISETEFNAMANKSVIDVLSDIDMRSMKRKTPLTPNLFDDIFEYTCPTDLKGQAIVDVKPQIKRGRLDRWRLTTPEEFDRIKEDHRVDYWGDPIKLNRNQWLGDSIIAVSTNDFIKKILLSRPIDDISTTISDLDSVGNWTGFGDGENLTRDTSNYVKGSAAINWDINGDGGTTAGIVNSSLDSFDISEFLTEGSVFVWAYLSSAENITNFKLRIGSSDSAYNEITITSTNDSTSFKNGWNLLRFDFADKSTTGNPDNTACTYAAIYMTKDASKVNETDYRFDWLVMKKGKHYDLIYYSKYGWQTSAGSYIEKSTDNTDLLNVDTDEYNLISTKCAENVERFILKNQDEAEIRKREYEEKKEKYILKNPSEALILTTTYHFINN